jgi:hypothetical protein
MQLLIVRTNCRFMPGVQRLVVLCAEYWLPAAGLLPIQESLYQLDYFSGFGEAIFLELRKNHFLLNQDIETVIIPRSQLDLQSQLFLDLFRQTGGY